MDIEDKIMNCNKGANDKELFRHILQNSEDFDRLIDCFFSRDMRLSQRSAILFGDLISEKPAFLNDKLMKRMLLAAKNPYNSAIKRNVIRTLVHHDIPEKFEGEIMDLCFSFVNDTKEATAVRAFSLNICGNFCKKYPELKDELLLTISLHEEFGSPGFKSICKRIKKEIEKY